MPKNISYENERFALFIKSKGLKQTDIAKMTGVSKSNISQIMSGKNGISNQILVALSREYNLNPEWIKSGKEPMTFGGMKPCIPIPIIADIPAGDWREWMDSYIAGAGEDYISAPEIKGRNLFAVRVIGDSMEPRLHKGDILVIDPHKVFMSDLAVVRHHWGYKIRIVRKINHSYLLHPLNPLYKEETITPDDDYTRFYVPVKRISMQDLPEGG